MRRFESYRPSHQIYGPDTSHGPQRVPEDPEA